MMDIQELIERLKIHLQSYAAYNNPDLAHVLEDAADALEELRAELEQVKRERDAAIKDIDSILAKAELIRRKIGYCLDYDSDAELASLCVDYCKNNVCEMCYEEREDGGCGNFLWRGQKEDNT